MKIPKLTLNIATAFSKAPAGRYVTDGPQSGQVFLERHLGPALANAEVVEIILDGTEGYGSSFLEESFGGLLRSKLLSPGEFSRRIELISVDDSTLISEIFGYIQDEEKRQAASSR